MKYPSQTENPFRVTIEYKGPRGAAAYVYSFEKERERNDFLYNLKSLLETISAYAVDNVNFGLGVVN
jgi:hypothetical protein